MADRIVVEDYVPDKASQLFKWVRIDHGKILKLKVKFHFVSKLKNKQGEDVAIIYRDRKLRIAKYRPRDGNHSMEVIMSISNQGLWFCIPGIFFAIGSVLMYSNKVDFGGSFFLGMENSNWPK